MPSVRLCQSTENAGGIRGINFFLETQIVQPRQKDYQPMPLSHHGQQEHATAFFTTTHCVVRLNSFFVVFKKNNDSERDEPPKISSVWSSTFQ